MKNLFIALIAVVPMVSMATSSQNITFKGDKAESLILSLLLSGFQGTPHGNDRSLKIENLVTVQGIAQHECDDEEVTCGFRLPGGIQSAEQNGKTIGTTESVQLFNTLVKIVDPVVAAKNINNTDAAMGRVYTEYGQIKCLWKLSKGNPYVIQNATCTFSVPNYQG